MKSNAEITSQRKKFELLLIEFDIMPPSQCGTRHINMHIEYFEANTRTSYTMMCTLPVVHESSDLYTMKRENVALLSSDKCYIIQMLTSTRSNFIDREYNERWNRVASELWEKINQIKRTVIVICCTLNEKKHEQKQKRKCLACNEA